MAKVSLRDDPALRSHFDGIGPDVVCGICSVKSDREWVVCPRRILCFEGSKWQAAAMNRTLRLGGWKPPQRLAVWRESKVIARQGGRKFEYTFDYIIRQLGRDGIPVGSPLVVEIMTSSTSGSDKSKGTDVRTAFCKAIRGEPHRSPGVNYRQVWSRMAGQLIVKSEAGLKWGGRTVWVIQDALADYIAKTTGLRLPDMRAKNLGEVNLLTFRYGEGESGPRQLVKSELFAGPISANGKGEPCFLDIIRAPFVPEFEKLEAVLKKREFQVLDWGG